MPPSSPTSLNRRDCSRVAAVVLGLFCGFVPAGSVRAQTLTPPRPERVGADAPHQERNPTQRPEAYQLRPAPTPVPVADNIAPAPAKVDRGSPPDTAKEKKKVRTARRARAVTPTARTVVPERKVEPAKPTPEEVAAEREARRAEMRRPMRVGNDAPHYERNADPDASAGRLITIERP